LVSFCLSCCLSAVLLAQPFITFTRVGSIPGPAELVEVQGDLACIAAEHTLTLYDVADPASPRRVGAYSFPEKVWGFRLVGSLVYVAADFFGLGILDVSNPAAPVLRGSVKTPGQAKNVALVGTRALVADHMSGVDFIDVSDVSKPSPLGSFFLDGYARDVVSAGSLAYAVDSPAGLYVFDLSKPGPTWEPVGTDQSANATRFVELAEVGKGQSRRIAVMPGAGLLQLYDVSNPASPAKITAYKTPGAAQRAAVRGHLVYVADGREGLQVVDLSDPARPVIVGAHKTATPARDVAVSGTLVFVLTGNFSRPGQPESGGEVVILRQSSAS
jgi:hypothetical protein